MQLLRCKDIELYIDSVGLGNQPETFEIAKLGLLGLPAAALGPAWPSWGLLGRPGVCLGVWVCLARRKHRQERCFRGSAEAKINQT